MLVCHNLFSVSGPGVPATSLLTPLRAESCSAIGQSSRVAGVVDVELGLGLGDAGAVGVAVELGLGDALGTDDGAADADADGVGLPEAVGRALGEADAAGDADGALELVTGGVPP